ncbi:hypothetical protein ACJX0J_014540, partial [Zea mays]
SGTNLHHAGILCGQPDAVYNINDNNVENKQDKLILNMISIAPALIGTFFFRMNGMQATTLDYGERRDFSICFSSSDASKFNSIVKKTSISLTKLHRKINGWLAWKLMTVARANLVKHVVAKRLSMIVYFGHLGGYTRRQMSISNL